MRIINPKVEELKQQDLFKHIELCGKTCYKSTDNIKEGSAEKFVEMIKNPSISSLISQLNFIKDNYDFITQSKSFLHTLSLEQKKNQNVK